LIVDVFDAGPTGKKKEPLRIQDLNEFIRKPIRITKDAAIYQGVLMGRASNVQYGADPGVVFWKLAAVDDEAATLDVIVASSGGWDVARIADPHVGNSPRLFPIRNAPVSLTVGESLRLRSRLTWPDVRKLGLLAVLVRREALTCAFLLQKHSRRVVSVCVSGSRLQRENSTQYQQSASHLHLLLIRRMDTCNTVK